MKRLCTHAYPILIVLVLLMGCSERTAPQPNAPANIH